jgi:NAD(P)-dependent dehydrogenase (short-subunit alcohol dehydrogenase family)
MSFAAKICLVTGANKGIGLELVRQLSASGASVYAACRQTSPELNAVKLNGGVVVEDIGMLTILYIYYQCIHHCSLYR